MKKTKEQLQGIARLKEIQEEMENLIGEADEIIGEIATKEVAAAAAAYWISQIEDALTNDRSGNMLETIEEIENGEEEEEEEEG